MRRYVEQLKERPVHVRRNVALGLSAGITALIAVAWFGTMASTGAFALSGPEDATPDPSVNAGSPFSELLGAVNESIEKSKTEPELTIVDGPTSSTITTPPENNTEATVIPF